MEEKAQQKTQKREARIINAKEFTDFLNHFLFNTELYISTSLINEAKTDDAPNTHGVNIILNQGAISTKSEVIAALNTYCDKVELVSSKELGLVAKCELLVGPNSNLPKPENVEQETMTEKDENSETKG